LIRGDICRSRNVVEGSLEAWNMPEALAELCCNEQAYRSSMPEGEINPIGAVAST
jgi:hypothetical protein